MKGYETIFITQPDLDEDNLTKLIKKFKTLIKKTKGKLVQEYVWGRRKLAYPIANKNFGVYHVWYLTGNGEMLDELHKQFRFNDNLIRFQSVMVDDLDKEAGLFNEMLKLQNEEAATRAATKVIKNQDFNKVQNKTEKEIKPTDVNDTKESISEETTESLEAENTEISSESQESTGLEKKTVETEDSKQ